MSKYLAKKTMVDGILFDSKKEAQRYQHLKLLEKAGVICDLKMQVKYELVPAQYIDGKCVERAVTYTSDFEYYLLKKQKYGDVGSHIVEDVKGYRTDVYKIKKKLMLYKYGVRITEM